MVDILEFSSGSKVVLIDNILYLGFGKKSNGHFVISFNDIQKKIKKNVDNDLDIVNLKDDILTVSRTKDYVGDVLCNIDDIKPWRKANTWYTTKFDVYETAIILAIMELIDKKPLVNYLVCHTK